MPFAKKVISGGSGISKDDIDKINKDIETRFNALTSKQQQDAEVIDARDGEVSLKARLDRDIEKAKQVYVNVEGSYISTDSSDGYLKDVEILGNTIQSASNLADIRSVGDKLEGQELYKTDVVSCGKNIFNGELELGGIFAATGEDDNSAESWRKTSFIRFEGANLTHSLDEVGNKYLFEYDNKFNFIRYTPTSDKTYTFSISSETKYVKITYDFIPTKDIQLEEGTVATPYEPYVEEKSTILSPVQLEKVGDVADRIVCKDGVWGVEKNVTHLNLFDISWLLKETLTNTLRFGISSHTDIFVTSSPCITNIVPYNNTNDSDTPHIRIDGTKPNGALRLWVNKADLATQDVDGLIAYLKQKNAYLKYILATPTFIPLPHDQQVKLRTFANKTNISFLTEIEGTIKAQVPKSIGAAVNTHTEQINNLNKELDRVKKLEESTVSTVTTESDFTTVEATSNGYFEDVKLEGKTLIVNSEGIEVGAGTEGATLKSVGDTTDEIVVSSVKGDGNLFDKDNVNKLSKMWFDKNGAIQKDVYESIYWIRIEPSTTYTIQKMPSYRGRCGFSKNKPALGVQVRAVASHNGVYPMEVTSMSDENYLLISGYCDDNYDKNITEEELLSSIQINKGDTLKPYTPHQSDKKRLLYYNNETQTWEKPILRQWDSIEKHANGKYYYHQRSGEVVLNGSESWTHATEQIGENTLLFYAKLENSLGTEVTVGNYKVLVDKFNFSSVSIWDKTIDNELCMISPSQNFMLRINKSRLATQDVQGFKQWLQANNVTVVYQLAQEKVYECTNIDLITYNGETNYIVECGAIVPKTTLKVHNNISNVILQLQRKVSILENDCLQMFKYILAGDIQSLAYSLYPEDFSNISTENTENTSIATAESTSTVNTSIKSIEDTEELPENDGIIEEGTIDNPIKFSKEINLEVGKYYTDYNVLYICIKSTTEPPTVRLNKLVDEYVQKV